MTKDSVLDRLRVTKTGKFMRRKMGVGHFRAKKSGKQMQRKTKDLAISKVDRKVFIKKYGVSF